MRKAAEVLPCAGRCWFSPLPVARAVPGSRTFAGLGLLQGALLHSTQLCNSATQCTRTREPCSAFWKFDLRNPGWVYLLSLKTPPRTCWCCVNRNSSTYASGWGFETRVVSFLCNHNAEKCLRNKPKPKPAGFSASSLSPGGWRDATNREFVREPAPPPGPGLEPDTVNSFSAVLERPQGCY